ncbi:MAG: ribosome recycling factor [Firmicutes bacterium]|uniref:Ribosome-recycling factor n=1 Tax=Candidatus Stercoripulliclostridium pullicola TaxID=2840953 RepID=A0A940DI78_9FIRM|nr:ribosome recycling factor [Candidatus Stercoripulliclostridium pullicola]
MVFDDLEERTAKTISNLRTELQSLRAGRANPHILDKVTVPYYGVDTPLNQMANITVPEARMLVINVWDQSALKAVEKAIIAANVGIFPTNDGKVLRMVFPELTEERRRSLVKDVKVAGENAKVAVRNIRRDAIDLLRGYKKDSVVTEDDLFALEKDVDKAVNAAISDIDKICSDKETEIMSV